MRDGKFQNIECALTLDMAKHLAMVERDAKDGKTFADSRDVVATFGKNHRDVLAAIRDLIEKVGEIDLRNFTQINFTDAGGYTPLLRAPQFRGAWS